MQAVAFPQWGMDQAPIIHNLLLQISFPTNLWKGLIMAGQIVLVLIPEMGKISYHHRRRRQILHLFLIQVHNLFLYLLLRLFLKMSPQAIIQPSTTVHMVTKSSNSTLPYGHIIKTVPINNIQCLLLLLLPQVLIRMVITVSPQALPQYLLLLLPCQQHRPHLQQIRRPLVSLQMAFLQPTANKAISVLMLYQIPKIPQQNQGQLSFFRKHQSYRVIAIASILLLMLTEPQKTPGQLSMEGMELLGPSPPLLMLMTSAIVVEYVNHHYQTLHAYHRKIQTLRWV